MKYWMLLASLFWAAPLWGQPPIPGRFGCAGYDRTRDLSSLGDLGQPAGGSPMNNGFQFVFVARNVSLDLEAGVWDVELRVGTGTPTWVRQFFPVASCLYYPEVVWPALDAHQWLTGTAVISHVVSAAYLTVVGYDGVAAVAGDLSGAKADDGVLFTLPLHSPHLLTGTGGAVVHGGLWLQDLDGVKRFFWAVYPAAASYLQPITLAQLAAACVCVP